MMALREILTHQAGAGLSPPHTIAVDLNMHLRSQTQEEDEEDDEQDSFETSPKRPKLEQDIGIKLEQSATTWEDLPSYNLPDFDSVEHEPHPLSHPPSTQLNFASNVPENEATTSLLKNSQFLQDCSMRFLCILSLDRWVFF